MEREVGEVFEYNGRVLRVEEAAFCKDCYFKKLYPCLGKQHCKVTGMCEYNLRGDGKSVSFVKLRYRWER